MRKLLNTLYITTPKSYLSLDSENIVVLLDDDEKFRLPFVNIENIVCFGYMGASPALMGKCAKENISLSFLKPNGEFLARIVGKTHGNVNIRKNQYYLSDDKEFCLEFSKNIMSAKFFNSRNILERFIRENTSDDNIEKIKTTSEFIKDSIPKIYETESLDSLLGLEGKVAKLYFEVFDFLIVNKSKGFSFTGRSKRPPLDNVNCMLSYLYTILSLEVAAALETVGIDPYVGFYHQIRSGRSSLALDLVEELRAYLVDSLVLRLINLKIVNSKDFVEKEGGGILFTNDGRKKILGAWQEKKKETFMHPIINEKIEFGLIPYVQAQLLARFLRGDINEYPIFLSR